MKDNKLEKEPKEYQCKNCKITWLFSSISLIVAISCIFATSRLGIQLSQQKLKFEDELVTMKSFIIELGLKSNFDLAVLNRDINYHTMKSRSKRSIQKSRQDALIGSILRAVTDLAKHYSEKETQAALCNKTVICVGRRGKRGKAGPRGLKGERGDIGLPGTRGPTGLKGPRGLKGDRGDVGLTGSRGPTGLKGEKGEAGPRGPPGLSIEKARITSKPSDVTVNEGSTATFTCEATGYPKPDITWLHNNKTLTGSSRNVKIIDDIGLEIQNVSPHDNGTVRCIAENIIGKDETSSKLVVLTKPVVNVNPSQLLATRGLDYEIKCTATGSPLPDISWKKLGGRLPTGAKIKADGTLVFQNIEKQDSGAYTCQAKNSVGSAEVTVTVLVQVKHKDCKDVFSDGLKDNGIYKIWMSDGKSRKVYCDMKTDGGGWTVFQRRIDASVDFDRGWDEYKRGFGDLNGNFWLGLDNIHRLTAAETSLRIDMKDVENLVGFARYDKFKVLSEFQKYKLKVKGYKGNFTDSLTYHDDIPFSTQDNDNDNELATKGHGGTEIVIIQI